MGLEFLILVLLLLWILGAFAVPVGGSAIHFLLVVVLVLVAIRLISGRPAA